MVLKFPLGNLNGILKGLKVHYNLTYPQNKKKYPEDIPLKVLPSIQVNFFLKVLDPIVIFIILYDLNKERKWQKKKKVKDDKEVRLERCHYAYLRI